MFALPDPLEDVQHLVRPGRGHKERDRLPCDLGRRVAVRALGPGIPCENRPVQGGAHDRVPRGLHNRGEPCSRRVRLPALGDVTEGDQDGSHIRRRQQVGRHSLAPSPGAVAVAEAGLDRDARAPSPQDPHNGRPCRLEILGMNQIEERALDQLFRKMAEQPRNGRGRVPNRSDRIEQHDDVGAVLDQRTKPVLAPLLGAERLLLHSAQALLFQGPPHRLTQMPQAILADVIDGAFLQTRDSRLFAGGLGDEDAWDLRPELAQDPQRAQAAALRQRVGGQNDVGSEGQPGQEVLFGVDALPAQYEPRLAELLNHELGVGGYVLPDQDANGRRHGITESRWCPLRQSSRHPAAILSRTCGGIPQRARAIWSSRQQRQITPARAAGPPRRTGPRPQASRGPSPPRSRGRSARRPPPRRRIGPRRPGRAVRTGACGARRRRHRT